jgi:hypothetical protein
MGKAEKCFIRPNQAQEGEFVSVQMFYRPREEIRVRTGKMLTCRLKNGNLSFL